MNEKDLIYVSEALLASAFYYGFAGGFVGCAFAFLIRFIYKSLFRFKSR